MDTSFFSFIEKLEALAFFAGFPLVYVAAQLIVGSKECVHTHPKAVLKKSLPLAYTITGTLYFGMQLHNLYPDFLPDNIRSFFTGHWSRVWGLSAVLFWIPVFRKKNVWCLLHSLPVFILFIQDLIASNNDVIKNDMKVYTDSLMLNAACLLIVFVIYYFYTRRISKKTSH